MRMSTPQRTRQDLALSPAMHHEYWADFIRSRAGRFELIWTLLALVITLIVMTRFLNFVEGRPGAVIDDPILELFAPVDLTWLIFLVIYAGLAAGVALLEPRQLVFGMQLYTLVVLTRMVAMYLVPLEPPAQMILLRDPLVEFFGDGRILTRDLFFSGHTATLFVLFLASERRRIRFAFLLLTAIVATALLMQHVHYTIDVVVAIIATYANCSLLVALKRPRHGNIA